MIRTVLAFLIAPLSVPTVIALILFAASGRVFWVDIVISSFFSFGPTWLIGIPLFIVLRARHQTQLRRAVGLGFIIAVVTWIAFHLSMLLLGWITDYQTIDKTVVTENDIARYVVWLLFIGVLGAIVGTTLWFIARPDRATVNGP